MLAEKFVFLQPQNTGPELVNELKYMSILPSIDDSDERLAIALQNSSQEALNILYDRYASVLLGMLQKIIGDGDLAEEALQTSFLTIWRNKDFYNSSSERLFTWILKIARESAKQLIDEKGGNIKNQRAPLYVNDSNRENMEVPPSIIEMILFGNISQEEAAEKMGISINELRLILRKEINKLRGI